MYTPSSSLQSSESEEAQNGVQPAKRRRIRSQKMEQTSSTMSSEEFGMYGYDPDKNQNDQNMLQQELEVKCDTSDESDPETTDRYVYWEVAQRVTRLQAELYQIRSELVDLYAENERLKIKLTALQGQ